MKSVLGYGRYNDDPEHVGCPRARSDMTPCMARDGHVALAEDDRCVGCNAEPLAALQELKTAAGLTPPVTAMGAPHHANELMKVVRRVTEPASPLPGDTE